MKRQRIRKLLLALSLLLFPVTLYYFSPVIILQAGMRRILNGSLFVFAFMFLLSIVMGRSFCAWLCPAGAIQELLLPAKDSPPKQGWRNYIKYGIWLVWILIVVLFYATSDSPWTVDFFFMTKSGISVADTAGYIIYYFIVALIIVPCLIGGKRVFCHYLCWMAPFLALGTTLSKALGLPRLHIATTQEKCTGCQQCDSVCPMSLDVRNTTETKSLNSLECIQCGACVDVCPHKSLGYKMSGRK